MNAVKEILINGKRYKLIFNIQIIYQNLESSSFSMQVAFGQKLSETSRLKVAKLVAQNKLDINQLLVKRAIDLFYQINSVEEFDPAEQFTKIQNVPLTQQSFCESLNEVLFKKTKKFLASVLSLRKPNKNQEDSLNVQPDDNLKKKSSDQQKIEVNNEKILYEMLRKIRIAAGRLEQLLFHLIDLYRWKCQHKKKCRQTYMEGYLLKIIFKKLILSNQIFRQDIGNFMLEYGAANKPGFQALKKQIYAWGSQVLFDLVNEFQQTKNIDQRPLAQIKYFICKNCYCLDVSNLEQAELDNKKNKKKRKNKIKKYTFDRQQQSISQKSRKSSLFELEQNSTCVSQQVDDQLRYAEQKNFERANNFLMDLKIQIDNRHNLNLQYQTEVFYGQEDHHEECSLMKKVNQILNRKKNAGIQTF